MTVASDPVADLFTCESNVRYIAVAHRLAIGAKRNLACREAGRDIIAQCDDDDWYAPDRFAQQVAPILDGSAAITGLANHFMLEYPRVNSGLQPTISTHRMSVGDVHGGTLVYRKSIQADTRRYPETNLAEDASLLQQAIHRRKRLVRLENADLFVYLRHNRNAWKFDVGDFLNPKAWNRTTARSVFSPEVLDL
jgi:glycosyltransferase involved in cell wall biosynthesis